MNDNETLPKYINVMYTITYEVAEVIEQFHSDNRDISKEMVFTIDDIVSYIETEAITVIREARVPDLILHDENGEEL